jgi:hypothetical protein
MRRRATYLSFWDLSWFKVDLVDITISMMILVEVEWAINQSRTMLRIINA